MKNLNRRVLAPLGALLIGGIVWSACTRAQAVDPRQLEQQYGVSSGYGEVATPDGKERGTVVPVTLADGRKAELFIPPQRSSEPHGVYLRDEEGLHPVQLRENVRRDELVSSPSVVARRSEPAHRNKRSWEKDALIIGGSAGGGAAIGAIAAGKKGAGVGAAAGGIGGLIYDLATRNK